MKRLLVILVCFTFVLSPFIAGACPVQKDPGLVNGGFEDNFLGWTTGGSTGVVTVANLPLVLGQPDELTVTPVEGEKMGAITYPAMEGFVYDNFIYQDVLLEERDKLLVLHYFFWTYDEAPFDSPAFTVSINGMTMFDISAGDIGDGVLGTLDFTGWTELVIPVGQYYDPSRPATIRIAFNAGNTGDNQYASGVFLDDIRLEIPIPGTVLLFGSGLLGLIGVRRRLRPSF